MIIIAVYNIKGGVGKTATAVNQSYLAAIDGYQTLLCDLDPQASASYYFRIKPKVKTGKKSLLKGGKSIEKSIKATDFDLLDLLPSDFSFRNLDISLDHTQNSRTTLRSSLRKLKNDYDLIFLDCPPNITLVSENIFHAADIILVPIIPTTLSYRSYKTLDDFFKKKKLSRKKLFPFFSMVEKRKKMHQETILSMSESVPGILKTVIPYSAVVERMGVFRKPLLAYGANSPAGQAYQSLWQELKNILNKK
jgi:cellulose biosynthesis protein BcsQ